MCIVGTAGSVKGVTPAELRELNAGLEARIARYKVPRRFMLVEELPKTALGKVQRGALARMF